MSSRTRYERDGPIARLTLARPEKLNAVDPLMLTELTEALDRFEADDEARVLLVAGDGRAFSAGFDLESSDTSPEAIRRELERDFGLILRFWDCPKPTIAAVHGYCLGSSLELAAACDITIAAEGTRFGEPEVSFGSGLVCLILPWIIGVKHAKDMLLTGAKDVDARRALAMGLVSRVVADDSLLDEAMAIAMEIARNDTDAVRVTKREINRALELAGLRDSLRSALDADIELETGGAREA